MPRVGLEIPPGILADDTTYAASGRYADCSGIRWNGGRAEIRGGCERLVTSLLGGVCRTIFHWVDNAGTLDIGFGTHATLEVFTSGSKYDITPALALPAATLGAAPIATTNLSSTVVVTQRGHPFQVGDSNTISGASAVATVAINGTWAVTAVTTDTWSFTAGSAANATTTGGGSAVVVTPQRAYAAGLIDGTGGQGYGTGAYDTGEYSEPSVIDYFPRTWSLAAWGENLIANWRGGPITLWANNTATRAAPVSNSPARVTAALVSDTDQVFALGCNEEVSGVFNPRCIRHSGVRRINEWSTLTPADSTAREYTLSGAAPIITGRCIGAYILVWTTAGLHLGRYVGSIGQPWRFDRVGDRCGIIGPNAVVVVGSRAFWLGPDLQFYTYSLGGAVQLMDCPIRNAMADNMAPSQGDKVVASSTSSFQEIRFDYPDVRDGVENSRYLTVTISGPDAGAWARGQGAWSRTAYVDAGPAPFPVSADVGGRALWQERGQTDDGAALSGFLETADVYLDDARASLVQGVWPDLAKQVGPVWLSILSRFKPQADVVTKGPVALAAGQVKADIRANGRLHRIRYEFNSAPAACRWGKPVFDVTLTGRR